MKYAHGYGCWSVLTIAFGLASCATTPPPPAAPIDVGGAVESKAPLDPSRVDALQQQWAATKRVHFTGSTASDSPWTLTDTDLTLAQEAASPTDRETMRVVHQSRFNQPVFFAHGTQTEAGLQAQTLVQEAWTHGVARPKHWPNGLEGLLEQQRVLQETIETVIARPLSDADLRRQPTAGDELDLERIGGESLSELKQLDGLRAELRTLIARLDGVLLSRVWQLARASHDMLLLSRWYKEPPELPQTLFTTPETALHHVVPHHEDYDRLRAAYARYSRLARRGGGWETLPITLRY
ncbi:MAG: hypothetical protein AAFX99_30375, partial [Myxococcota bacterium]